MLVTWTDCRSQTDIYAQRVDSSGVAQWPINGVPVYEDVIDARISPIAVPDGAGGAIIAWLDTRIYQWNVFVQRVDSNGQALWAANGIAIGPNPVRKDYHALISEGSGGAIITWSDARTGQFRRYAQRISSTGEMLWQSNGVDVSGAPVTWSSRDMLVEDGNHGALCAWSGPSGSSLYFQKIAPTGNTLWAPGGIFVSNGAVSAATVHDDGGGLITAWGEMGSTDGDLFAQRITSEGSLVAVDSEPYASDVRVSIVPNPARGALALWVRNSEPRTVRVSIFDLQGRRVRDLGVFALPPGDQVIRWDGRDGASRPVGPGIYLARFVSGGVARAVPFAVLH